MDDKKLEALAKRNAAKPTKPKAEKLRRRYDDTLPPDTEDDLEVRGFFKDMKQRDF